MAAAPFRPDEPCFPPTCTPLDELDDDDDADEADELLAPLDRTPAAAPLDDESPAEELEESDGELAVEEAEGEAGGSAPVEEPAAVDESADGCGGHRSRPHHNGLLAPLLLLLRLATFEAADDEDEEGRAGDAVDDEEARDDALERSVALRYASMLPMLGLPRPVTGSHPTVLMNPWQAVLLLLLTAATQAALFCGQMLLPSAMSLNVPGCAAAIAWNSALTKPSGLPVRATATSLSRAMRPAQIGAATLVPDMTCCVPLAWIGK